MESFPQPDYYSSLPSTTALKENLTTYFDETRDTIEKLIHEMGKQSVPRKSSSCDDSTSDDDDEAIPSSSNSLNHQKELLNKLQKLSACVEESTVLLAAITDIRHNHVSQLEADLEKRNDVIKVLESTVTRLNTATTSWSKTPSELLSLRRSHDSRLDYVCKIKRELAVEKAKNAKLLRLQTEIQTDSAAMNLSWSIDNDKLKAELQNEKNKTLAQELEILSLKKKLTAEKARSRAFEKPKLATITKNSVKMLQKQLCEMNVSGKKSNVSHKKPTSVPSLFPRSKPKAASFSPEITIIDPNNTLELKPLIKIEPTSTQLAIKYLQDTPDFLVSSPLFNVEDELPILTLDENF